jgi:transcriptional regulator with GAF, ATPase, and Fis domain
MSQTIDDGQGQSFGAPEAIDFPDLSIQGSAEAIVHKSEAIRDVLDQMRLVAPTSATVLLLGETGVGKEVFAQAIHDASPRRGRPMVRVNCAAIPSTLIERELFGHERGAFTGAFARQIGRFEAANGSTLFLDEIGELPLEVQVKLLRVLQERTIERLGGNASIKVDVRIVAATNLDLDEAVRTKSFRQDLFYRLNVFPITVPPLRDRVEDIPALVWRFIDEFSHAFGKPIEGMSSRSMAELLRHSWPGNVRELRNVIERAVILATGPTLSPTVCGVKPFGPGAGSTRLDDVQAAHIRATLDNCGWRIRGSNGAAFRLGMKPSTLESRMAKLGITRPRSAAMSAA